MQKLIISFRGPKLSSSFFTQRYWVKTVSLSIIVLVYDRFSFLPMKKLSGYF